jgi:hypothetical protein
MKFYDISLLEKAIAEKDWSALDKLIEQKDAYILKKEKVSKNLVEKHCLLWHHSSERAFQKSIWKGWDEASLEKWKEYAVKWHKVIFEMPQEKEVLNEELYPVGLIDHDMPIDKIKQNSSLYKYGRQTKKECSSAIFSDEQIWNQIIHFTEFDGNTSAIVKVAKTMYSRNEMSRGFWLKTALEASSIRQERQSPFVWLNFTLSSAVGATPEEKEVFFEKWVKLRKDKPIGYLEKRVIFGDLLFGVNGENMAKLFFLQLPQLKKTQEFERFFETWPLRACELIGEGVEISEKIALKLMSASNSSHLPRENFRSVLQKALKPVLLKMKFENEKEYTSTVSSAMFKYPYEDSLLSEEMLAFWVPLAEKNVNIKKLGITISKEFEGVSDFHEAIKKRMPLFDKWRLSEGLDEKPKTLRKTL